MPENGWKVLTVREDTADKVKKLALEKSVTVDEIVKELLSLSIKKC